MFSDLLEARKSRKHRRPASTRSDLARRNVYHRRLFCEELEDRRLLCGVTIITHGFEWTNNPDNLTWLDTMASSIAGQIADAYSGSTQNSSQVAQITMKISAVLSAGLNVGWSFPNGAFEGGKNPSSLDLASSLGAEAVIMVDWSSVAALDVSTQAVADAVDTFLTQLRQLLT